MNYRLAQAIGLEGACSGRLRPVIPKGTVDWRLQRCAVECAAYFGNRGGAIGRASGVRPKQKLEPDGSGRTGKLEVADRASG